MKKYKKIYYKKFNIFVINKKYIELLYIIDYSMNNDKNLHKKLKKSNETIEKSKKMMYNNR